MNANGTATDFGFVITKAPLESGLVSSVLAIAHSALDAGRTVSLFLVSDGVWLAKRSRHNNVTKAFKELIARGAEVAVSKDHLTAAGIEEVELFEGIISIRKTYKKLVENVMEKWDKVMVV
jgi:predicted peroxiredoxin